jgi:hypothetical protein
LTAGVLDRVPVDEITARARQIHLGHVLATIIGGIVVGLSWCAAKVLLLAWFLLWGWLKWLMAAFYVGWDAGAKNTKLQSRTPRSVLEAENARLKQEIARLS